ncbi:MAG TPA: IS481 family transposase [Acidimicrobiales bacterium]|nr:IS481 family transposase [Acidimicrobiales bacterium]
MHRNAPLTVEGRRRLCERIASGWTISAAAEAMNVSRQTASKWWHRWLAEGEAGLRDRSSRPRRCPHRTPHKTEKRIVGLRRRRKLGPARIASIVGMPRSTVHRVLVRHGMNRLAWMDRPTGAVVRRIHTDRPGELVHFDVKKQAVIPPGGGHRAHGRAGTRNGSMSKRGAGYLAVHSAVDAHTRYAYSEILDVENAEQCVAFLARAHRDFAERGIVIERLLTDSGPGYKSHAWAALCAQLGVVHTRIRPYRPQTNGKVERFNRTLADEWAYVRPYRTEAERLRRFDRWLHDYNHHRGHTALGGRSPIEAVNNQAGHHS